MEAQATPIEFRVQGAKKAPAVQQRIRLASGSDAAQAPLASRDAAIGAHKCALLKELYSRFGELSNLDWCAAKAQARARIALAEMLALGGHIAAHCDAKRPPSLNISGARTGEVLFTLFGVEGREAELWVGAKAGTFQYVLSQPDGEERDGEWPTSQYTAIAGWLHGTDSIPG